MSELDLITKAKKVIDIEIEGLQRLKSRLNHHFESACEKLLACKGRVVVTGIGKSGHIASKIAATLASTGTPAFFVHPAEASHGDLGMITKDDCVIAISYSGNTQELVNILPVIKRKGTFLISFCGNSDSMLARISDITLDISIEKEACPLGLAPTASTTNSLALGDALAVVLLEAREFTPEDFALSHPGGSLGKKLLLTVRDIMHQGQQIPIVTETASIIEALMEMTQKSLGMTAVVDATGKLTGIYTDGDVRRTLAQKGVDIHQTAVSTVMSVRCTTVTADILAAEAANIMEHKKINGLIVIDQHQKPIGAVNMMDLLRAQIL
jgi:arabinose-5-phosphate isomerase